MGIGLFLWGTLLDLSEVVETIRASAAVRILVAAAAMYALLWAYGRSKSLSARGRFLLGLAAGGVACLGILLCSRSVVTNFLSPREWDFLCFWTYGRALARGQSPYDIEVLREIAAPQSPTSDFLQVNICLYPPMSLPLFWPFGHLPFQASMAAWYVVQVSALIACVILFRKLWDETKSWLGLLVALAIFFTWHSTQSTLFYGQTNFLVLLAILCMVFAQSPYWWGICLGLAIVVKPIAAILLIDLAIRRQWRSLLAVFIPPVVALGLFLLVQGWPGLSSYLNRPPTEGVDAYPYYIGTANQSLLGVLLRWFEEAPLARPVFYPPFIVLAGLLTVITVAVLTRLSNDAAPLGIGYVLTLALLVYPGTQMYYSLWLLVPFALLWRQRDSLPGGAWVVPLAISLAYGLIWTRWSFAAHLIAWLAMTALLGLRTLRTTADSDQRTCQEATQSSAPASAATARLTMSRVANTTGS